jgi:choline dehydrogenase-like flavoprotein
MSSSLTLRSDVIVVGSGPGGATVSRELAQRGNRVLLLERGIDQRSRFYYGTYPGAMIYSDRLSLLFTQEGLNIVRPLMVGGATSMYCGCAAPPPAWLKRQYGVDIDEEVSATIEELEIAPLPAELRGEAPRIAQARRRWLRWQPSIEVLEAAERILQLRREVHAGWPLRRMERGRIRRRGGNSRR